MTQHEPDAAVAAFGGLVEEFRRGRIVARAAEREGMERRAGQLTARWNERFAGFPTIGFPYTTFWGEYHRGKRDAHLVDVIVQLLGDGHRDKTTVAYAAARLPHARVIASDVD